MRYQKPIKNREKLYAGVLNQVESKIGSIARQHDCSKSFVTNTILAEALNVKIEERYYDYKNVRKVKRPA